MVEGMAKPGTGPVDEAVRRATRSPAQTEGPGSRQAKQEEELSTGPDPGNDATAAVGGSQTSRFERFPLQASTSGGGT